ncbi:hypothetical protein QBC46DRAFT_398434 [Diplogelasinospora grovesii]|uniref:Uncharacterized protein n=1 Tax=Diplogelasinospora grovesii TaxID=303347 RepID=A0AAN6MX92_9PEZI|nr:hypothetical protein QBC46DRAFT_398434 [Diplogelasinospora grovesii]
MDQTPQCSSDPPSYESVLELANPRAQLSTNELPSFVMDGTLILHPSTPPSRAMYELSSPPYEALSQNYAVHKVIHKVVSSAGEPHVRISRLVHIYDFRPSRIPLWLLAGRVLISPPTPESSLAQVEMFPSLGSLSATATSWTVAYMFRTALTGVYMFKTDQRITDKFRSRADILWRDQQGKVVAVETRLERDRDDGRVKDLPRLQLKVELDDKMLDLLVASWAARVWREALRDLHSEQQQQPANSAKKR